MAHFSGKMDERLCVLSVCAYEAYEKFWEVGKDKAWETLATEGLTSGLDSVKVCREACWFYDEQEKIKDLYKNNPKSEQKMLSELNRRKPMMLKMLDGIDKRKKMEEEKTKENIGKDFVW